MVTRITLKDGGISIAQQAEERIREICGVSKESFYGSPAAAKAGFLNGMWTMQVD